jgi:Flp pilus assembly protein TadB
MMIKQNFAKGLSLTVLLAFGGGALAVAAPHKKSRDAQIQSHKGDRIETQNPSYKGLKSPHSARKDAAKRLKVVHQQERQRKMKEHVKGQHGYTGKGRDGGKK